MGVSLVGLVYAGCSLEYRGRMVGAANLRRLFAIRENEQRGGDRSHQTRRHEQRIFVEVDQIYVNFNADLGNR